MTGDMTGKSRLYTYPMPHVPANTQGTHNVAVWLQLSQVAMVCHDDFDTT